MSKDRKQISAWRYLHGLQTAKETLMTCFLKWKRNNKDGGAHRYSKIQQKNKQSERDLKQELADCNL